MARCSPTSPAARPELGVVGFDVLKEHQLPVAQLVDRFGGCWMAVAVKASGYERAADLPLHCRVASKFTHCAREYFDASICGRAGASQWIGGAQPITGMSDIVDLRPPDAAKDNGLVAIDICSVHSRLRVTLSMRSTMVH